MLNYLVVWNKFLIFVLNNKTYDIMSEATVINSLSDLREAINHPYRNGEFLHDGTQVLEVTDDENEMIALIEMYDEGELFYHINWESDDIFTEDGTQIPSIY